MIAGRQWPQLGGDPKYLDIVGVNYYRNNQWIFEGPHIYRDDPRYRPVREMLAEVHERYGRPMIIAETGDEAEERVPWLDYMAGEALAARATGVPLHGICLYPVADYPGWDDDRHCPTGLLGYPTSTGERPVYAPLAARLRYWQQRWQATGDPRPAPVPAEVEVEKDVVHPILPLIPPITPVLAG